MPGLWCIFSLVRAEFLLITNYKVVVDLPVRHHRALKNSSGLVTFSEWIIFLRRKDALKDAEFEIVCAKFCIQNVEVIFVRFQRYAATKVWPPRVPKSRQ